MITRKQYMAKECTHREYYAQFVTDLTKRVLLNSISLNELLRSEDKHLNDIPIKRWDMINPFINIELLKAVGEWHTMSTRVCVLKEAARQLIEAHGQKVQSF